MCYKTIKNGHDTTRVFTKIMIYQFLVVSCLDVLMHPYLNINKKITSLRGKVVLSSNVSNLIIHNIIQKRIIIRQQSTKYGSTEKILIYIDKKISGL